MRELILKSVKTVADIRAGRTYRSGGRHLLAEAAGYVYVIDDTGKRDFYSRRFFDVIGRGQRLTPSSGPCKSSRC
jgi:hypothetical protein